MKMKQLLSLALALLLVLACVPVTTRAADGIAVDETNFPDPNFRAWILEQDYGADGVLTAEELAAVTHINVYQREISDLTGIEYFTALVYLGCGDNDLTTLDVSKNMALEELVCSYNQLTSLDVRQSTALRTLECHSNQLISLDVSKNTALTELGCDDNQLTSLDVSKNTALTELYCGGNQLTSLDVSKNLALEILYCYTNQLTSLDVSKNTALEILFCDGNQLTSLDVSKNTALTELYCGGNQLTSLDVSKNTALIWLHCEDNRLTSLDVSKNTALTELYCYSNQLTSLDVSKNTALIWLNCHSNQLTSLDVSKNTALTELECHDNQLTSLDVSKNTALEYLWCNSNELTIELDAKNQFDLNTLPGNFDVTKTSNWEGGTVSGTVLTVYSRYESVTYTYQMGNGWSETFTLKTAEDTTDVIPADGIPVDETNFPDPNFRAWILKQDYGIDGLLTQEELAAVTAISLPGSGHIPGNIKDLTGVEHFTSLSYLSCMYNQLTHLDVSQNTALDMLYCSHNQLTSLDVSSNTALTILRCGSNQLTSLDVSKNTAVYLLDCSYNQLTSLDVSNNTELSCLECFSNQLTSLDVSKNTGLRFFWCYFNKLTSLDVSNNTALEFLYCYDNKLTSLDLSNNPALTELDCGSNQLTSLDLSNNPVSQKLNISNQQHYGIILNENNQFDLSTLPGNFDVTRASFGAGCTVDGTILTVDSDTVFIYYTYTVNGGGKTLFSLRVHRPHRRSGDNRWATSIQVADEIKAALGEQRFSTMIIASGNNYVDALAGSYLAALRNAPVLLSYGGNDKYAYLDEDNIAYIKENLDRGGKLYILGGTDVVPDLYEKELSGYNIKRLAGADRFETNLLILKEAGVKNVDEIVVCTATNFADSLSASAVGTPILLVWNESGRLLDSQKEYLSSLTGASFTIVGGECAVSTDLEKELESYGNVERLAGADRFETSVLVAQRYFPEAESAVMAYAMNYPDGLCGGALAYAVDAPLILTMTQHEDQATAYIREHAINFGFVLGGEKLISEASVDMIFGN